MIRLARIAVYPFKSLDPVLRDAARVLPSGALEDDRRFALCDSSSAFVNAKRDARIHRLRSHFDASKRILELRIEGSDARQSFHVDAERSQVEGWFSTFFEAPVTVVEDAERGFPDDPEAPGPTVVSTATLQTVAAWFPGMSLDEARLRFRANLEIEGVEPFWEDRLFAASGTVVRFSIGDVAFDGTNPCARCVVPSRAATTGIPEPMFQKVFAGKRQATLPPWSELSTSDHCYRLAVNTRPVVSTLPATIGLGDKLHIDGLRPK